MVANGGMVVEGLVEPARPVEIDRREHGRRLAPSQDVSCQKQGFRKIPAHEFDIVQHRNHGAPFALPLPNQPDEIGDGSCIHGAERFVEKDDLRILQEKPRANGTRFKCPPDKAPTGREASPSN